MQKFTRFVVLLWLTIKLSGFQDAHAQSVLNPADPLITYNVSSPPAEPVWDSIGKWVRTVRLGWNSSAFKAYIYKGNAFRLKFPKSYNPNVNDGKKYPMLVFFHGRGESGSAYDNEYSLYHGGEFFNWSVDIGNFDGYIMVMQNTSGFFGSTQFNAITEIIEYMAAKVKLDPFQINVNGLSAGGQASWDMAIEKPQYISSILPMSWCSILYTQPNPINTIKRIPIWIFQGGVDGNPTPYTTEYVRDSIRRAGGYVKYTLYPTLGHGTWNAAWSEPDFWGFQKRAYLSNPWPLTGRTEFCPGDPINVTLVLPLGLSEYQWRKRGVVIPGANSHNLSVSDTGLYEARVKRGGIWSEWSRTPAHIKIKAPTVSPAITVSGLASKVLPALDGSTSVKLEVPEGYVSYTWQKTGDATILSTTRYLTATPGDYIIKVTEQFGCSSNFSAPFTVVNAGGPNKPDAPIGLIVVALSQTSLRLDWADSPSPFYNETNFEVYQSSQQGGRIN